MQTTDLSPVTRDVSSRPGDQAERRLVRQTTGVSVVVPMFDEADVGRLLVESLDRMRLALGERFEFEFLLVDDGSRDATVEVLRKSIADRRGYRILRHDVNRGIGAAIQTGIRHAAHDVVVSMDCDGSYDPLLAGDLVSLLGAGVDLVTASPYHVEGAVENVPLWRLRLSRWASRLYSAVTGQRLTCYTSCFRAYRRSSVVDVRLRYEGFVGVAELLCQVLEAGGQVVECPARLRARVAGHSKMKVARATRGHLALMARVVGRRVGRKVGRVWWRGDSRRSNCQA